MSHPIQSFLGHAIEKLTEDARDFEDPTSRKRYEEGAPNEHDRDIDQVIGNRLIVEGLKLRMKYLTDRTQAQLHKYAQQAVMRAVVAMNGVPEAEHREPPALNGPRSDE